jgi:hypothetical protein
VRKAYARSLFTLCAATSLLVLITTPALCAPPGDPTGEWTGTFKHENKQYEIRVRVGRPRQNPDNGWHRQPVADAVVSINPPLPESWEIPSRCSGVGLFNEERTCFGFNKDFKGAIASFNGPKISVRIRPTGEFLAKGELVFGLANRSATSFNVEYEKR